MADIGVALHAAVAAAYCQYASLRGIRGALISAIGRAVPSNRRHHSGSRSALNLRDALSAGLIRGFTGTTRRKADFGVALYPAVAALYWEHASLRGTRGAH